MSDKSLKKEIQVGVVVLAASLILVVGLLWLKQVRFSGGVDRYVVDFEAVSGLQTEDRVNVRGIRMGAVDDFELHDGLVRVYFHVEKGADLRRDAEIHLQTIGIVGEKIIDIVPGTGDPAPDGHVFAGVADADLTALTANASNSIEDAKAVTGELHDLLVRLREQGLVDSTLIAAKGAARTIETSAADLAPELKELVVELRGTTRAINDLIAGPDSALARTLTDARSAAARADSLTATLIRAGDSLAAVMARLENGEGTAGRLLRDEALYARAESTITAVQDLIADVKARPKRYFHVSLF